MCGKFAISDKDVAITRRPDRTRHRQY